MSFAKEWKSDVSNAISAAQEVTKVTAISWFSGIINASPVGNTSLWETKYPPTEYVGGNYRSNWYMTKLAPTNKVTDETRGKSARLREIASIATDKYSPSYWLSNNTPQAEPIEGGHSTQAPLGVVAPQQALVNSKIKRFEKAANIKYGVE